MISRLNLTRELKPSETPAIGNIASTNNVLAQATTKKKNALSKLISSKAIMHEKVVQHAQSLGYGL